MDTERTGGPAYPANEIRTHDTDDIVENATQGMTYLDVCAIATLQGMYSSGEIERGTKIPEVQHWADEDHCAAAADWAYLQAVEMLKARNKYLSKP